MSPELEVQLLGRMRVLIAGKERDLPSSRKTRALLAYLAVTGRSERRERLCELFWDVPDDPRGALRWSLSKIRALVDTTETKRVKADREFVQLELSDDSVDWQRLRTLVRSGTGVASTDVLRRAADSGGFLDGLNLPGCEEFNAWCIAERENVRGWRIAVLDELTDRPIDPDEAIGFARSWSMLDPFSAKPWERLVHLLLSSERVHEADQQRSLAIKMLAQAGTQIPSSFRAAPRRAPAPPVVKARGTVNLNQKLRFCSSVDGATLAYSVIGSGPPLICAGFWMNHLENDITSPIWRPWIEWMASERALLRYDTRGFGLSDREVELSLDLFVADLEAVADAARIERFDLYGMAQGAVVAVAYAARNPDRVRRLVLQSSYALGFLRRNDRQEIERRNAMITLATSGWSQKNRTLRQMFSGLYLPSGNDDQIRGFDEFFKSMMLHPHSERLQVLLGKIDIRETARQVKAPTLVLHSHGEVIIPLAAGREMATLIPDARFVTLDTSSHLVVEGDPAWTHMTDAVSEFLS